MSRKCFGLVCPRPNGTAAFSLDFQSRLISWEAIQLMFDSACSWNLQGLSGDSICRFSGAVGFCGGFTPTCLLWPNMEASMILDSNFPRAPDALAFAKAAIKHIVCANVAFRPMAFERL